MDLNGLTQKLTVKKRTAHLEIIEAASWLTWASLVYCSLKSSFSLWSSEIRLKVVPPPIPLFHSTLILPTYATPSSHCYTFAMWLVRHSTNYSLYHPVQSAQLTPIACIVSWKKETFQNIFPPSEEQALDCSTGSWSTNNNTSLLAITKKVWLLFNVIYKCKWDLQKLGRWRCTYPYVWVPAAEAGSRKE